MTTCIVRPHPGLPVSLVDTGTNSDGRAVLVLHGGSGPAGVGALVEHLAQTSRVLAPTHPGWDGTPRPEWFTGVDSLAIMYLDLLEAEGLRDVIVVGHSFGGWVASELAIHDEAHLVSRLVLIDAIGPAFDGHEVPTPRPQSGRGPTPADIAALRAYAGPTNADSRLRPRLARVQVPVLLIWGERDAVVSPAFGRLYADAFACSRFETVPGAGHVPMLDDPGATWALVDGFLT